jgi:hypothetical protein
MKRLFAITVLMALVTAIPVVRADVKTTERTTAKLGGFLGGMSRMFGSSDPITSTTAIKGDRRISINDTSGEIVDLAEEKVYRLDVRKKEYRALTFAQVRKEWEDAKAEGEKSAKQLQEAQRENPEPAQGKLEFTANVKETGQRKAIAGHDTREVVLTITGVQAGKTLEEGGGLVLTNTMWLGPRIAAVDEIVAFNIRYYKAIMGEDGAAMMQQLTMLFAFFANAKPAMDQMMAESRKLQGTPLASTLVMETVRGAEQAKAAASNSQQSSGGGGIGGMLGRRIMGGRGGAADGAARQTTFTSTRELLTVATSAGADDVAVPAGFKEKK